MVYFLHFLKSRIWIWWTRSPLQKDWKSRCLALPGMAAGMQPNAICWAEASASRGLLCLWVWRATCRLWWARPWGGGSPFCSVYWLELDHVIPSRCREAWEAGSLAEPCSQHGCTLWGGSVILGAQPAVYVVIIITLWATFCFYSPLIGQELGEERWSGLLKVPC